MTFRPVRYVTNRGRAEEMHLLLQSLGIDAYVYQDDQTPQYPWVVAVETARYAEAQRLIEEEEAEPLPASPEPMLGERSSLVWVVGLVLSNVLIWWAMEQRGGSENVATLLRFGAIRSARLAAGEWWRSVTAIFLHIGPGHLLGNMLMLSVLGSLTVRSWGAGRFLFIYVLSGLFGNWLSFMFGSASALKAGASGAILGLLGALAGARLRHLGGPRYTSRFKRWHVVAMLIAFYGLAVGMRPSSDHVAHLGGLLSGGLIALLLPALPDAQERVFQLVVGFVAIALCLVSGMYVVRS